jgi:hypothetical protein
MPHWARWMRCRQRNTAGQLLLGGAALFGLGAAAVGTNTNNDPMISVQHFTSQEIMNLIIDSGNALYPGSYVTTPGQVSGMTSSDIERRLEIGPGKGAWSTTFQTPLSNLTPLGTTSGGAAQFILVNPTTAGQWAATPH